MNAITKQTDRFTEADIDAEIVIMRLDTGDFFSLSGSSAAIWRLIDGQRDRASLLRALANEFQGDEAVMATDVDEFMARLRDMDLLAKA